MGRDLCWVCRELDLWISREAPTCRESRDGDQAAGASRGGTSLAGFGLGLGRAGLGWVGLDWDQMGGLGRVALRRVALVPMARGQRRGTKEEGEGCR